MYNNEKSVLQAVDLKKKFLRKSTLLFDLKNVVYEILKRYWCIAYQDFIRSWSSQEQLEILLLSGR